MLSPIITPFKIRPLNSTEKDTLIRPFLRWVGGKQRLVTALLERMPKNWNGRYFEPFLGGGSLFFANQIQRAELSDLNPALVNAYHMVRDHPQGVHIMLSKHLGLLQRKGEPYYYELRKQFNLKRHDRDVAQAARFIFLIHSNFNGIFRVNRKGEYNAPYGHNINPSIPSLDHLKAISQRLNRRGVKIVHRGYDTILGLVRAGDFVYLDPPYPVLSDTANFTQYTDQPFLRQAQSDLADFAFKLHHRGAYVMISSADVRQIQDLYQSWNFYSTPLKRTVSSKKGEVLKATELIITNYKP